MAFITQEDIITLIEGLISHIFTTILPSYQPPCIPFPRLTHSEALKKVKFVLNIHMRSLFLLFAVQF